MKKTAYLAVAFAAVIAAAPSAFAQGTPNFSSLDSGMPSTQLNVPGASPTADGFPCTSDASCTGANQTCDIALGVCQTAASSNITATPAASGNQSPLNAGIQSASNNSINATYTCTPACQTGYTCTPGTLGNTCVPNAQGVSQQIGTSITNSAQSSNFVPLAAIPGLTQDVVANSSGLASFLNNLYLYLIGLAAILAVIYIIWGGLEIATQDSVSKHADGRARITQAILGLVLILSPVLVFYIINPAILNLSVHLPALNTKTGTWAPQDQIIPCVDGLGNASADCTLALNKCKALMTPDSVQAKQLCTSASGGTPTTGNDPVTNVSCFPGTAAEIDCSGVPNTGGAGQAGLSSAQPNATAVFDGHYVDLVQFTGATAKDDASHYSCQGGPNGLAQTGPSLYACAQANCEFALCYVPRFDYIFNQQISSSALQEKYSSYAGDCAAVSSILSAQKAGISLKVSNGQNSAPVACDPGDAGSGNTPCYQGFTTCTPQ